MPASPYSVGLVTLQFGLLGLLTWPIGPLWPMPWLGAGLLLMLASIGLAVWALAAMRRDTFSVLPEPVAGGQLCTQGPYAWIRHPMYSAVLMAGLGLNLAHGTLWQWLGLATLAIVLGLKIHREEGLLRQRYAQYDDYRKRTGALLPRPFGG